MLPEPDMDTTKRLMAEAGVHGKEAVGELSAAIMSANVCFLIGSVGSEKTAEILREWAAVIMRREMVVQPPAYPGNLRAYRGGDA